MASSILNSDDGVISGTSGLKSTGGDDGVLNIQNNGTTAVTVASDGDVGIGTNTPSQKLDVTGTAAIGSGSANYFTINGNTTGQPAYINAIGSDTNIGIDFNTKGTGAFRVNINSSERIQVNQYGLCFNGDTAAANALDDYEEGTFTPTYVPSSGSFGSITYAYQSGKYTKIGNVVTVFLELATASLSIGGATGNVVIGGLPFAANNLYVGLVCQSNNWAANNPNCLIYNASTSAVVGYNNAIQNAFVDVNNMNTTTATRNETHASFTYYTA